MLEFFWKVDFDMYPIGKRDWSFLVKFFLGGVEGSWKFKNFSEVRKRDMYYVRTIFEFEEIVWR